ncbi:glycoside hydrolase family 38 C-terminal domain-containing protein [Agreia sp. Leaf283]|uniref:alpha-mannosidase n=1 Tax=Agreia sp. Leaf283 TaxID=1736321 RepID=UPI0006FF3CE6|nr:glycoside hydrolase family 38 C-terminal domain-containing protein [Agreia sp. Leaf283]KQP53736.1 alpha-mannosidase [Agreia sp. Leaf283]
MHDTNHLIEGRLERFLRDRIRPHASIVLAELQLTAWHVDGGQGEPVEPAVALSDETAALYEPFEVGDAWGPAWGTTWFRVRGRVPSSEAGRRIELLVDLGWHGDSSGFQAEGLVYTPDGRAVKGLNPMNQWIPIAAESGEGADIDLYIEAAANPQVFDRHDRPFTPTPLGEKATAGIRPRYRVNRADIVAVDEDVTALVADLEFLGALAATLGAQDARRWRILEAIDRALDLVDPAEVPGSAPAARAALRPVLDAPAVASAHRVSAIGHAHIDSAWLWPTRETVRKVARTAANVLQLMEDRPELKFVMSSAQQWVWLRDDRPELYARVLERVREGRFIPVGGMWVESDTNMVGGEAMVRQFVAGSRFFHDELGIDSRVVWLPDSFGYSAALPQIVRLAGFDYFLTQKISWNQVNTFPHHTFDWVGIDGTTVFTHFPAADTYNGDLTPAELAHTARNFADKARASRSLIPFGFGDGGGGPVREMLDRAERAADIEGLPRVAIESPEEFFDAARTEYDPAPQWFGELYLELHRGTYTSQSEMKSGNRRSEHLLREAELWATTAAVRGVADYPVSELAEAWRLVLLQQFHDILPGSSIAWVHREARERYALVRETLERLIAAAQEALAGAALGSGSGRAPDAARLVFNARPHAVDGVPAGGAGAIARPVAFADAVRVSPDGDGFVLSNDAVTVRLDGAGTIVSIVTAADGREAVAPGQRANLLQLHDDKPVMWDAWDIDGYYRNAVTDLLDVDGIEMVPGGVLVRRGFGASTVEQRITLDDESATVHCATRVDWHETEKLLKLSYPVDVHAERARFETQFGHLSRPIHENTSWDAARFEVCAHRWVHVGEGEGVAIANDSSYGHEVRRVARQGGGMNTIVRVSLLRAPTYPDPDTDHGVHEFHTAIVPSASIGDAVRAGYELNIPLREGLGMPVEPLVAVVGDGVSGDGMSGVVVEAVKLAEDGSGDVIVRLYESLGQTSVARVSASFDVSELREVDLLERPMEQLGLQRDPVLSGDVVTLRAFEIATLRFVR